MSVPVLILEHPWLTMRFDQPMRVLSWAINRPGFVTARRIVWREVRNADLPLGLDVHDWLATELAGRAKSDAVTFLTSRSIARYQTAEAHVDGIQASAVATVGLSNAERVGMRRAKTRQGVGTINVAVSVSVELSDVGLLEALSIAVAARTAAVMDADLRIDGGVATGTGTDCLAMVAHAGVVNYAGLHTTVGEAVGRVVYDAVRAGAEEWKSEQLEVAHAELD